MHTELLSTLMVIRESMLLITAHSKRAGAAALVTVREPRHVGLQKGFTLTLHQGIGTAKALRSKITSSSCSSICSHLAEQLVHLGEGTVLLLEAAVLLQLLLLVLDVSSSSSSVAMPAGVGRFGRITPRKVITTSMITRCLLSRGQQPSSPGAAGTASPPLMLQ
jgi:hypothetical protein